MHSELPPTLVDYLRTSRIALAVASAADDNPLLYVNQAFTTLTGYDPDDVLGRNCRKLQHNAPNIEPRARLREFIANDRQANVRTLIVNFRKDGRPFVNLLYMSRLRGMDGRSPFLFASQFDVSRSHADLLTDYNDALEATLGTLAPIAEEAGIVVEGTLLAIANSAATIAQAKMMLARLDAAHA